MFSSPIDPFPDILLIPKHLEIPMTFPKPPTAKFRRMGSPAEPVMDQPINRSTALFFSTTSRSPAAKQRSRPPSAPVCPPRWETSAAPFGPTWFQPSRPKAADTAAWRSSYFFAECLLKRRKNPETKGITRITFTKRNDIAPFTFIFSSDSWQEVLQVGPDEHDPRRKIDGLRPQRVTCPIKWTLTLWNTHTKKDGKSSYLGRIRTKWVTPAIAAMPWQTLKNSQNQLYVLYPRNTSLHSISANVRFPEIGALLNHLNFNRL